MFIVQAMVIGTLIINAALPFYMSRMTVTDYSTRPRGVLTHRRRGQRLGRRSGMPALKVKTLEDLRPWEVVRDEALRGMSNATLIEGFSYNKVYSGSITEKTNGQPVEVTIGFDVGLLQWAERT